MSSSDDLGAFDLRRIAEACGCSVLEVQQTNAFGRTWPVLVLDCGSNENAIKFLNGAAKHDAWDPRVRELGLRLRRLYRDPRAVAAGVQAFVKRNVDFVREKDEVFQHTIYTLSAQAGDCDDHARAVAAICMAAGLDARIEGVRNSSGDLTHVCAQAKVAGVWVWLETTLDAKYGEEPYAAKRRLSASSREDIG